MLASSGAEALEIIARASPDAVLLDLSMPTMTGQEVLERLHAQGVVPALPVVILTAMTARRHRIDALRMGAFDFLTKPFDRLEVEARLRTAIELHQLRATLLERSSRAEAEATEATQRLALPLAQLPLVLWEAMAVSLETTWVSENITRVLGVARGDLLGIDSWQRFVHPDDLPELVALLTGATGGRTFVTVRWRHPEVGEREVQIGASTVGERIAGFALDITDSRSLERKLRQAQKMEAIGHLTGGIAHDFNNILAAIIAYGSFARDALPAGSEPRTDIEEALGAANRAVSLTRQLLTFSRRQSSTSKRPVDLNKSLTGITSMLRRMVGEHITLQTTLSPRPAVVRLDPVQFDQVVLNLAVNARDAMPEGGHLRFVLSHPPEETEGFDAGRRVRLVVADTGIGMSAETISRLFDPFFTTKGVGEGTGLGLAVCYAIVLDAGGRIEVSSAEGAGATFTIDLPICDELPQNAEASTAEIAARPGARVLLVEDDHALRGAAVRILKSNGYAVTVATNGDQAIAILDKDGATFDLIISDIVMPGSGGFAVAKAARTRAPQAQILLVTGYIDRPAMELDEDIPLLWKPYTGATLLSAADRLLESAPVRAPAAPVPAAPVEVPESRVVLHIEDEPVVRKAFQRILKRGGYETRGAPTAAAGRSALDAGQSYAAVLCDLSLPDGSGADLVRWIARERPELAPRTIILTGGSLPDGLPDIGGAMQKPVDQSELLGRLDAVSAPPVSTPAVSPSPPVAPTPTRQAPMKARVLLVDDDRAGEHTACQLRREGLTVTLVASAEAALEELSGGGVDVLITDVCLPGMDGVALLRRAHQRDPDLPVLLITGASSMRLAVAAIRGRAANYLTRPVAPSVLISEIERAQASAESARLQRKILATRGGLGDALLNLSDVREHFAAALAKLRVVFQPIVRSADRSLFGYESFLRTDEDVLGSPQKLILAARALGRVGELGRATRGLIIEALRSHPGRMETLFVNVHPEELVELTRPSEPLLSHAHRIVLEVTDRARVTGGSDANLLLGGLREVGFRLSLDDLGAGYAGLSSLARLKPDIAKIDISLVRNAQRSQLKQDIIGSLARVCRRSGIISLAEGVETKEEAALMTELGCDLLQGYLFGRPGPGFGAPLVPPRLFA